MSFQKLGEQADNAANKVKSEGAKVETEFKGMSKTLKYIIYGIVIIAILALGSCMLKGCGSKHGDMALGGPSTGDGVTTPFQPIQQQPVVVQQGGSGAGDVVLGAMAGMAIGSMMSNGQRYNGHNYPTVVHKTVIINKVPNEPARVNNPVVSSPTPVVAVAPPVHAPVKVKNPGDTAAEQAKKNDALKAQLKAKQATRVSAPVKTGGYKSFSKGKR